MTSNQAKALALHSVYRRTGDAAAFVQDSLERTIRNIVYMRTDEVEHMIDGWLRDAGYWRNFCADCIMLSNGCMAVRLLYREAMLPNDYAGLVVGLVSFAGVTSDGRLLPAPVVV